MDVLNTLVYSTITEYEYPAQADTSFVPGWALGVLLVMLTIAVVCWAFSSTMPDLDDPFNQEAEPDTEPNNLHEFDAEHPCRCGHARWEHWAGHRECLRLVSDPLDDEFEYDCECSDFEGQDG